MKTFIQDGAITTPTPAEGINFQYPFTGYNYRIYKRRYYIDREYYTRTALDTESPDVDNFYLVDESPLQRVGSANRCEFTRTYAEIPGDVIDWQSAAVNFPGWWSPTARYVTHNLSGMEYKLHWRRPKTRVVPVKVIKSFFQTTTPDQIAVFKASEALEGGKYISNQASGWCGYTFENTSSENESLSRHNLWFGNVLVMGTKISYAKTTPSIWDWEQYINNNTDVCIEDSKLERWMGNIWMRTTSYVKAA